MLDFVTRVFGAEEVERYEGPDGGVMHCEMRIGDAVVMIGDANADFEPMPALLSVYVDDVDATHARALEAGATSLAEPEDMPWGHRTSRVRDVAGNRWVITAVVEQVTREEVLARMASMMGGHE